MKEFTENLNNISVRNSEIKKDIDMKQASLADLQEKVRIEEDKKRKYEAEIEYEEPLAEPEVQKEMLKTKKEDLKKELKQVEFRKNDLEKLGNMADLKSQKKIFTDKYRCIIKKLLINKLQSNIVSSAQKDFDRTQPDLVNAEKFLYELTNRKYNKINLELQEIETPEGRIKKWDELSRGTKEQLYLALRLGLASNYSKDKITLTPNGKSDLPLIIDDAFVNFDMNRTQNTLKCLEEFAKTNQILYFTCHKNTIETVLNNLKIEYNKINL